MKSLRLMCVLAFIVLSAKAVQDTKGWRGLVPLHSTRADVERLLGPSRDSCKCRYRTDKEAIDVEYSAGACKGYPPGWNVPRDTVVLITVRSSNEQKLSDLHTDWKRYTKFYDDAGTTYYASRRDGIMYEVAQNATITGISYIASTRDNYLRCSGFPSEDASTARYKHFDEYSKKAVTDESARLDNFAVELQNNQDFRGYVIAYAGRRARADEAQTSANEVKGYLTKKRGVEPKRIVTIDGGHREQTTVELYLLSRDLPPPVPTPTIGTCEVQIIKARNNRGAVRPRK